MTKLRSLFGLRRPHERTGFALYGSAVSAAREPVLYTEVGVPDTLDGRFEMVSLHVFFLIDRLRRDAAPGPDLAQAVFDAMFSDMDINLRELGVGDLSVGKKVKTMWEAFHGRAAAYRDALASADPAHTLGAALTRNVWRGGPVPQERVARLVRLSFAQATHLGSQPLRQLQAGTVTFLTPAAAKP